MVSQLLLLASADDLTDGHDAVALQATTSIMKVFIV